MGLKAVASTSLASATLSDPTITGTVTASQVTGIPIVLAKWGVPVGLASSGTMGNNGAVSGMTALPTTYSAGIWLYIPAGAIAAGVPAAAAFRWFKGSSTTAGTFYDSTWDGLSVPTVGTTTAFSTTGPGAFTGVAAGEITVATITVPAGAMGPNGVLRMDTAITNNSAAGNKIFEVKFGALAFQATATTNVMTGGWYEIRNLGVANFQKGSVFIGGAGTAALSAVAYGTVDSASAVTFLVTLEKATATNHAIFEGATVTVVYGA